MDWMDFVTEQWLLFTILLGLVVAVFSVESKRGGQSYSFHEATMLMNKDQAIIVDLRDRKDYSTGHIHGAIHIPYLKIAERSDELAKHKDKAIILTDKMGQHASAAARTLREKGLNAGRLSGGMTEWQAQNLPVVKA